MELKFLCPGYKNGARPDPTNEVESPYITLDDKLQNTQFRYVDDSTYWQNLSHKLYIQPGHEVTVRALFGDWYVTSGNVNAESY